MPGGIPGTEGGTGTEGAMPGGNGTAFQNNPNLEHKRILPRIIQGNGDCDMVKLAEDMNSPRNLITPDEFAQKETCDIDKIKENKNQRKIS